MGFLKFKDCIESVFDFPPYCEFSCIQAPLPSSLLLLQIPFIGGNHLLTSSNMRQNYPICVKIIQISRTHWPCTTWKVWKKHSERNLTLHLWSFAYFTKHVMSLISVRFLATESFLACESWKLLTFPTLLDWTSSLLRPSRFFHGTFSKPSFYTPLTF